MLKEIIFSVFSTYKKNLVLLVFDFMLWTLLLYQFLLPIAFLREWCCIFSLLLFRYFSSWKKSLFSTANLYTTTHTLDHIYTPEPGELYLFSGRTESFHLENCNCEKRAEHEGNERRNGEENNRETNSSTGIPILYNSLKYNAWYIDAWREKPSGNVSTQCHSTWKPSRKLLCKLRHLKSWS